MVLWVGIISISLCFGTRYSFSEERCEYPSVLGAMLYKLENRLGEYRITLDPPDYKDSASVQQHVVSSNAWGHVLSSRLLARTRGLCDTVITSSRFPDLHAYLSIRLPSGDVQADRSLCTRALRESLLESEPSDWLIKRGADEAAAISRGNLNPAGFNTTAILTRALAEIYEPGSVLRAINSIRPEQFRSLDADTFLTWLDRQLSSGRVALAEINLCPAGTDPQNLLIDPAVSELVSSRVVPPGVIKLPPWNDGLSSPADTLQHVVVVGHDGIPDAPLIPSVVEFARKYCDQSHALANDGGSVPGLPANVHVRCLETVRYAEGWMVLYCDPGDCTSERASEAVATAIANDPEVVAFAGRNGDDRQPRGPYLVNVESSGE